MNNKVIIKSVPSRDYRSVYEPSINLIQNIADDARNSGQSASIDLNADAVLRKLLAGEEIIVKRFGTEVHWTLEADEGEAEDVTFVKYPVLIIEGENAGTLATARKREALVISGGYLLTLETIEGKKLWVHEDWTRRYIDSRRGLHICKQRNGHLSVYRPNGDKVLGFYTNVEEAVAAIDTVERRWLPFAQALQEGID